MTEMHGWSRTPHRARRGTRPERGTTLVLVPTLMVVFLVMAGIAVDLSVMHMARRRALAVVSVAASDAAGMIDDTVLQLEGEIRIDTSRARSVAEAHIGSHDLPGEIVEGPRLVVAPDRRSLTISLTLRVGHTFIGSFTSKRFDDIPIRASARLIVY